MAFDPNAPFEIEEDTATAQGFDPAAPYEVEGERPLAEGESVPAGYETFHDPMQGTMIRPVAEDRTYAEKAVGAGEAALALGTGATTGAVGYIGGVLSGLYDALESGTLGTKEGAQMVKKAAEELSQAATYAPRTEAGQEYTQAAAETLAPLEALGPLGAELEAVGRASRMKPALPRTTATREAVQQAEALGITPMTSDILPPKTFTAKTAQAIGERIPVVGTGPVRATQQQQRISAVKNYLAESGVVGSEAIVDDVMKSLSKSRQEKVNKFINLKKDSFSNIQDKVIPTNKTTQAIDSELSRLTNMKTEGVKPLIKVLEDYKQAFQDQDIVNIEALRKQLGDQLDDPAMTSVSTEAGKSSKNVYQALNEDIGTFIKENGSPKDFNKWKVANKQLSSLMGELENNTLKSILRKSESSPEDVKKLLFSKKPSDIRLIYKNLNPEGRANARTAILHEVVDKAGGIDNFSIDKFQTNLKKLEKSTGIFFKGDDKKALDGLSKALDLTRRASQAEVKPITGAELTVPVGTAVLADVLGSGGASLATMAGVGGMARVFESKPVRNLLIQLSNAPKAKQLPIYTSLISVIQTQKEKEENK